MTASHRVDRRIERADKIVKIDKTPEVDTLSIKLSWLKEPIVSEYKKFDSVGNHVAWSGLRKPGNRG